MKYVLAIVLALALCLPAQPVVLEEIPATCIYNDGKEALYELPDGNVHKFIGEETPVGEVANIVFCDGEIYIK